MKTPANIVKREYFSCIYHVLDMWLSLCVGEYDLSLGGCCHFLTGCGWVLLFLAGCDHCFFWLGLDRCGCVWLIFGWVWVGVGECMAYNYPLENQFNTNFLSKKTGRKTFSSSRKSQSHLKNLLGLFSPESPSSYWSIKIH